MVGEPGGSAVKRGHRLTRHGDRVQTGSPSASKAGQDAAWMQAEAYAPTQEQRDGRQREQSLFNGETRILEFGDIVEHPIQPHVEPRGSQFTRVGRLADTLTTRGSLAGATGLSAAKAAAPRLSSASIAR